MASSPCNCWTHVTDSLSPSPPSSPSSSLPQTPSNKKSIEQVWKEIKLASLSNCSSFDMDLNKDSSPSDSSFVMQAPPTLLNLDSCSVFQKQTHQSFLPDSNASFDASESKSKKRAQQDIHDQRRKRMIKNRESALRSRARKQAYKKGLEIKISRITQENSRLRKQLEELQFSLSSSAKPPRKVTLHRTSSSPF